jgi:exodeoxyribonuclease V alpha subunit
MLRTRNLFYTAVTRARQMVVLVGSREVASQMVENNRQVLRYTAVRERLSSRP